MSFKLLYEERENLKIEKEKDINFKELEEEKSKNV